MRSATRIFFVASFFLLISCGAKGSNSRELPVSETEQADSSCVDNSEEGRVVNLTTAEFKSKIMDFDANPDSWHFKGSRPVVIDFFATWCGPCRQMAPVFEQAAKKYASKVDFYRVDVDKEGELAGWMQITSIPTLMFIPVNGTPGVAVGAMNSEMLNAQIAKLVK